MDTEELIKYGFSFVNSKDTCTSIEDFEPKDLSIFKKKNTPILEYISSELRRNGNIDRESRDFTIINGGCYEIKVNILFVRPFSSPPTHKLKILRFQTVVMVLVLVILIVIFIKGLIALTIFLRPLKPFNLYIRVKHINLSIKPTV